MGDSAAFGSLRTCLRLTVLLTVAHVSFGGARLALSLQAIALQASPLVLGLVMSLLMVVPAMVSVRIGRWADRAGHERPAWVGLAVLIAGVLLACAWPSLPVLGAASVLVGTGYTLAHVALNHAVGEAAGPAHRVRAFGLLAMGFSLSALVGPMLAGAAIDHIGHRGAFALLALPPVVSGLMLAGMPHAARESRVGGPAAAGAAGGLLVYPPLRPVLVISTLVSVGWDLFTFLVPLHGSRVGLSATAIGLVVGMFGVGAFVARLALPRVGRLVGEWTLLRWAVGLAAAGYFAFPFCATLGSMLPLGLALGLVLGCGQPLVMSLLHATAPPGRTGEAVGLRAGMISFGQTVLPLLFGGMGAAVGMFPLFWTAAGAMAAGTAWTRRVAPSSGHGQRD